MSAENCMVGCVWKSGAEATPQGLQLVRRKGFNGEGLRASRASPEQVWQARESSDPDLAWSWVHSPFSLPKGECLLMWTAWGCI